MSGETPVTRPPANGASAPTSDDAPSRERIAAVLAGLDAPSRELLDYSMRRRVTDEMLARLYQTGEAEIAQRRVVAVQRMTRELGAHGAAGLGRVLTALLEQETWDLAVAGQENATGAPVAAAAPAARSGPPTTGGSGGLRRSARWALAAAGVAVAAGAGGGAVALALGGEEDRPARPGAPAGARLFAPEGGALGNPFPTGPQAVEGHPTALVRREVALLDGPDGRRIARLKPRTTWGTPRVLSVAERRPGWLGVRAPELPNGRLGWIREADAEMGAVEESLRADLSERELVVLRRGKVVRRFPVAIGGPKTPTPTGTFAVTDKLRVKDPNSPYGCCVLALSGRQEKLPPGWPGGDRLAVHATRDLGGIGAAVSYGCFRARPADARWLVDKVPLGAPVRVRD